MVIFVSAAGRGQFGYASDWIFIHHRHSALVTTLMLIKLEKDIFQVVSGAPDGDCRWRVKVSRSYDFVGAYPPIDIRSTNTSRIPCSRVNNANARKVDLFP